MTFKKIVLPDLGEGVIEGEILKIKVAVGATIVMDQVVAEVMTDKASMEIPSFLEGEVQSISVTEGDIINVGATLMLIKVLDEQNISDSQTDSTTQNSDLNNPSKKNLEEQNISDSQKDSQTDTIPKASSNTQALAIPATRQLAKELDIDLNQVTGQGAQGKIKREDLIQYIKTQITSPQIKKLQQAKLPPLEETKRVHIRGIKRAMFQSMTLSKSSIPHFTIGDQAQVQHLVSLKKEMNAHLKKQNLKTGYLAFFIKALIPVLKEFPIFNSVYDEQQKQLVFKKNQHIAFAVDGPEGLVVPVIKNVQNKSLLQLIQEIQSLAESVRQGSIQRDQLQDASITLSNLGSIGGIYGTPIINPPELAIIGIYKMFSKVVKTESQEFEEKDFMNFSITCDHRFIDGALAARFLKSFINKIQEPSLLILD